MINVASEHVLIAVEQMHIVRYVRRRIGHLTRLHTRAVPLPCGARVSELIHIVTNYSNWCNHVVVFLFNCSLQLEFLFAI